MLIVQCDICGKQAIPEQYYYNENPHIALIRYLTNDMHSPWETMDIRISDTGHSAPYDLCPECSTRYKELLRQQERQRSEFFSPSVSEADTSDA